MMQLKWQDMFSVRAHFCHTYVVKVWLVSGYKGCFLFETSSAVGIR